MADNYSNLQKLCLSTIRSGAINAFIDLFRLTHMTQPLGSNQPQTFEDIIATAGPEAPLFLPEFAFDNPLSLPIKTLQRLQILLETSDNAGLQNQLFDKFQSLSEVSDLFLDNHKLRSHVKMLPLVMPFAILTELQQTKSIDILQLIDSAEFTRTIEREDPLVAAIAKIKKIELDKQIFVPVVIHFALQARNVLFEFISKEIGSFKCEQICQLMDKDVVYEADAEYVDLSQIQQLRFLLLLNGCFLRLSYSLNQFNLYKASYVVFQKFLKCSECIEVLLGGKFQDHFIPTDKNEYLQILQDDHVNLNKDKKDDNLAFANLEISQIPKLFKLLLDKQSIPTKWNVHLNEFALLEDRKTIQKTNQDELENTAVFLGDNVGDLSELTEFVYCGRIFAIMNMIQLACQVFTQQKESGVQLDFLQEIDQLIRKDQKSDELTLTELTHPELPVTMLCTYQQVLQSLSLLKTATQTSQNLDIYCMKIPAFKRLAELVSKLEIYDLAAQFSDNLVVAGGLFEINSLAWKARWARQQNKIEQRTQLLRQRYEVANRTLAVTMQGENGSVLSQQRQNLSTKYAVSAASELTFNSSDNQNMMENAWDELQKHEGEEDMGNTFIEARVRYGAVKGKENIERMIACSQEQGVEEGHDEDLDACLIQ
ncbi:hypothetical protein SS50377_24644 [Spironucleus salmonicida]|uniref:Uncharacterized protein n=1 Tax=Spironucleus salmonicida TaxID=348837 RepID=V6LIW8_9EUKA|nr:hypothetical protein SS50377_24644 [Spironucleus salmonicida]|eukprot:EST44507.1 hypothetical protein SS50377_15504 [Spironucleus salmonicida]